MLLPVRLLLERPDSSCNCGPRPDVHSQWRSMNIHDARQYYCQGLQPLPVHLTPFFCTVLVKDGTLTVNISNVVCGMAGIGKIARVEYSFDFHCFTSLSAGGKQSVPIRHRLFSTLMRRNFPAFLQEKYPYSSKISSSRNTLSFIFKYSTAARR